MPTASTLGLFAVAALVLYVVTRSIEQGRRAGLVSVLAQFVAPGRGPVAVQILVLAATTRRPAPAT